MLPILKCILLSFAAVVLVGCTRYVPRYRFTDVGSQRSYTCLGTPLLLRGGAVNFKDEASGSIVTLQSYEVRGEKGETYRVVTNFFTGKEELQVVEAPK